MIELTDMEEQLRSDLVAYIARTGEKPRTICDKIRESNKETKIKEPTIYNLINRKNGLSCKSYSLISNYIKDYEN